MLYMLCNGVYYKSLALVLFFGKYHFIGLVLRGLSVIILNFLQNSRQKVVFSVNVLSVENFLFIL